MNHDNSKSEYVCKHEKARIGLMKAARQWLAKKNLVICETYKLIVVVMNFVSIFKEAYIPSKICCFPFTTLISGTIL